MKGIKNVKQSLLFIKNDFYIIIIVLVKLSFETHFEIVLLLFFWLHLSSSRNNQQQSKIICHINCKHNFAIFETSYHQYFLLGVKGPLQIR